MFPVERIRNYRQHRRRLSPNQKEARRNNLLVVFGMSPIHLYLPELRIFIPNTTITAIGSILLGFMIPVIGLATRIKIRRIKTLAVTAGFVGFLATAFTLVQSMMETGFGVLSRDITTLDFKLSAIVFVMTTGLTAIGLITSMYPEWADFDPRRYA